MPTLHLRSLWTVALVLLAVAVGAASASARQSAAPAPGHDVLVVGDSLAVGMRPSLRTLLEGDQLTFDVKTGRTTPVGLAHLRTQLRTDRPDIVFVSLGTNDGPDPARFADRISRALAAIPADACVVWSDINRPPRKGVYGGLNVVLRRAAQSDPRLVIVDWDSAVRAGKVTLPDGLHPDPAGFEYRAHLFLQATQRCVLHGDPGGGATPPASPTGGATAP